jgi:hypothetical protein
MFRRGGEDRGNLSRREDRAYEEVVVAATGRDAPAQQLPRSGEDLVGAGRQLMTIDAGEVGPITCPPRVLGVLLDPPAIDQPEEGPAQI